MPQFLFDGPADCHLSITFPVVEQGGYTGLIFRRTSDANNYGWRFVGTNNGWRLYRDGQSGGIVVADGLAPVVSGTTMAVTAIGPSIVCSINGAEVGSANDGWQQNAINCQNGYSSDGAGTTYSNFVNGAPSPVIPSLVAINGDQTSVTFAVANGVQGTPPITRVGLFVGTTSDFVPSGSPDLTGTGPTFTLTGLSDDVTRFAILRVQDSTGAYFDSLALPFSRWLRPAVLAWLGDSITESFIAPSGTSHPTAPQACAEALRTLGGNRHTSGDPALNFGQGGTSAMEWLPTVNSGGDNILNRLIAGVNSYAEPIRAVVVTLLTNDAIGLRDAATVMGQIQTIANYIITHVTNWYGGVPLVILQPASGYPPFTVHDPILSKLIEYNAALPALDNSTTIRVTRGRAFPVFSQQAALLQPGGPHPTAPVGYTLLGQMWAVDICDVFGDLGASDSPPPPPPPPPLSFTGRVIITLEGMHTTSIANPDAQTVNVNVSS